MTMASEVISKGIAQKLFLSHVVPMLFKEMSTAKYRYDMAKIGR